MAEAKSLSAVAANGAARLPSVEVDSYNVELKDDEGFLGDDGAVTPGERAHTRRSTEIPERLPRRCYLKWSERDEEPHTRWHRPVVLDAIAGTRGGAIGLRGSEGGCPQHEAAMPPRRRRNR